MSWRDMAIELWAGRVGPLRIIALTPDSYLELAFGSHIDCCTRNLVAQPFSTDSSLMHCW
jgi:hypothetical protein